MVDNEKQNLAREKICKEVVSLSTKNKHLILELPTGSGKGKIVAECIANSTSPKKWLVCVPEINQIENYKADLKKFGNENLLETKIHEVICYASLKKYQGTSFNIHANEVHRLSDFRYEVAKTIQFDQIISDSATISDELKEKLWEVCPYLCYTISLEDAIRLQILPQPRVYILGKQLDDTVKNLEFKATAKKSFKNLTEQGYYNKLCDSITYWQELYRDQRLLWQRNKMLSLSMERKRFMAKVKTELAREVLGKLDSKGRRYICFCGSVAQAKELGGKKAINAKNSKEENARIIEEFNSKKTNSIFSCAMGVEGMNFFAIDAGILVQLDREERLGVQKCGRVLRSSDPRIYILYVKDTQDQKYLTEFLESSNINEKYIKYL